MSKSELRKNQLSEAVSRMKLLKLPQDVIEDFSNGFIKFSDRAIIHCVTDEMKQVITDFEEKYDSVVYHIIRTCTEYGEHLSLFYVSDSEEDWEKERKDLLEYPFVYVATRYCGWRSEFSHIGIENIKDSGLVRTL